MKYLSNFDSQEFGGKFYDQGKEIPVGKDEQGAMDVLVKQGRATAIGDSDPKVTSNGGSAPMFPVSSDFDAEAFIGRGLDDISADEIAALTPEQRDAVIAAENDREKPRSTLLSKLDDAAKG